LWGERGNERQVKRFEEILAAGHMRVCRKHYEQISTKKLAADIGAPASLLNSSNKRSLPNR